MKSEQWKMNRSLALNVPGGTDKSHDEYYSGQRHPNLGPQEQEEKVPTINIIVSFMSL
jgi:hypothetical protein